MQLRATAAESTTPALRGSRAPPSADVVDEVRLHPDAAVRDRRVRGRHLDRRDRDALADRDVADRRARPAARAAARCPALSPGKSIPVGCPKPKRAIQRPSRCGPSSSASVIVPTFDECERIWATRHRLGRRAARRRGSTRSATWIVVRQRERRRSASTRPSESAPATVTSLNVEPGSYVSVTARLRCSRAGTVGEVVRVEARARPPSRGRRPSRGSSTTAVAALRVPLRDRRRAAPPRPSPGSCGRASGRRRGRRCSGVELTTSIARPNGSRDDRLAARPARRARGRARARARRGRWLSTPA